MVAKKVSDEEFVELWNAKKGSLRDVAETVNMSERSAAYRRRAVERNLKITLKAGSQRPDVAAKFEHYTPRQHKAFHQLGIENGTIVVFSDAHFWPGIRSTAFRALLKLIEDLKPKAVICNGDAFDGASISRHPRIGWDSVPSVQEELRACKYALGEIEDAAGKAKLVWPLGNHDARFESRLAAVGPQFEGVQGFHLKDHFPAWIPCWAALVGEGLVIKHRYKGGIHATHNNAVWSGRSIVTGHLHSLKVTPFSDYNGTRWGVDTGMLADKPSFDGQGPQFADYLEGGPVNWRSGFAVLTMHKGELLWPELVHVRTKGVAEFRGSIFEV